MRPASAQHAFQFSEGAGQWQAEGDGTSDAVQWQSHDRFSPRQAPASRKQQIVFFSSVPESSMMTVTSRHVSDFSPVRNVSPSTSASSSDHESMNNHDGNLTPPDPDSVTQNVCMGRLSLEEDSAAKNAQLHVQRPPGLRRPGSSVLRAAPPHRRTTSADMSRFISGRSPATQVCVQPAGIRKRTPASHAHTIRGLHTRPLRPVDNAVGADAEAVNHVRQVSEGFRLLSKVDSGYHSLPSRQNTIQDQAVVATNPLSGPLPSTKRQTTIIQVSGGQKFPGLILQPDSSPISQELLQAEVKGIYHGLLMVEAKCINIDTAQAADLNTELTPEQWQALIALHRTLLYEHHDFLMATQHPSSTPMLRGLALKYRMPARMWKHGIHAFLEVLRRRRPASQDYMVSFIYLAYQMIALLYETVPIFLDTWIECLGDLSRYRMAIEPDKEAHSQWGTVATRWYTMAADRYPQIGRLSHHLGILERPSLRKFCYYAKSLNCILPFPNAQDSLTTVCTPIVQDEQTIQNSSKAAEPCAVTFHAIVYANKSYDDIEGLASSAVHLLTQLPAIKIEEIGVYLAILNVSVLFDLGNFANPLWPIYETVHKQSIERSRPSMAAAPQQKALYASPKAAALSTTANRQFQLRRDFCYNCANSLIRAEDNYFHLQAILPFVHVMCIWLCSLFTVKAHLDRTDTRSIDTISSLLGSEIFSWGGLSDFLNSLMQFERMQPHIIEAAKNGHFENLDDNPEASTKVLPEEHVVRGLLWSESHFPEQHFKGVIDDDSRHIDVNGNTTTARMKRVLWHGMYFACHTPYLTYDEQKRSFSAPVYGPTPIVAARTEISTKLPTPQVTDPTSPVSSTSERSVEDGFTLVTRTSKRRPTKHSSPAKNATPRASAPRSKNASTASRSRKLTRGDLRQINIVGEGEAEIEWEATR